MANKPKIGAIQSSQASSLSQFMPKKTQEEPRKKEEEKSVGRPRSLPDDIRTMTIRMSAKTHQALKTLAAQEQTTTKSIIFAGLSDQFAQRGIAVEVE